MWEEVFTHVFIQKFTEYYYMGPGWAVKIKNEYDVIKEVLIKSLGVVMIELQCCKVCVSYILIHL